MTGDTVDRGGVLTVPNAVSVIRILLVGVFWWLWSGDRAAEAGWLLAGMAATDWLDGWLARRLDQASRLGAILDPVGDGLMMVSAVLGGMVKLWVPPVAGVLVLARSGLVAGWSGYVTVRTGKTIAVRITGKVAITLLFISVPAFYWAVDGSRFWLEVVAWAAMGAGLVFHWWSGVAYLRDGWSLLAERSGHSTERQGRAG